MPGAQGPQLFATPADVLAYAERVEGYAQALDGEWAREDVAQKIEKYRANWMLWRAQWVQDYWRVRSSWTERIGGEYAQIEARHAELIEWRKRFVEAGAVLRSMPPACTDRGGFHPLDALTGAAGQAAEGAMGALPWLALGALAVGGGLWLARTPAPKGGAR